MKLAKMPDGTPEIYGPVIQGEGKDIGLPTYFVRLAGCNLYCKWCTELETEITLIDGNTKKIKNVSIGERLMTPYGETKVEKLKKRKVNKHVKVTLENGQTLTCTLDHPLITGDGKEVDAQNLRVGDEILIKK